MMFVKLVLWPYFVNTYILGATIVSLFSLIFYLDLFSWHPEFVGISPFLFRMFGGLILKCYLQISLIAAVRRYFPESKTKTE